MNPISLLIAVMILPFDTVVVEVALFAQLTLVIYGAHAFEHTGITAMHACIKMQPTIGRRMHSTMTLLFLQLLLFHNWEDPHWMGFSVEDMLVQNINLCIRIK